MRNSKNIRNSFFSITDTIFLPTLMLVVTPIFIREIGMEEFGMWMLINSLVVAMAFLNFGGVDTVIRYVSRYSEDENYSAIREVFSTVFFIQLIFSLVVFSISFILPDILIEFSIFNIPSEKEYHFIQALQFGLWLFSLKVIEQLVFSYFKGLERFDISSLISIVSKFLLISVQVLTVLLSGDIIDVFRNSFLLTAAILVCEIILVKRFSKYLVFVSAFSVKAFKEILHYTKWSWILSVIATGSSQIDRWLIANLATMQVLGSYSIAILVFNNIHSVLAASMAWVLPKSAQKNNGGIVGGECLKLQYLMLLSAMFVSYVSVKMDFLFKIWLGSDTFNNVFPLIKSLISLIPLYSLSIIPFYIVKGSGYIKFNVFADLIIFISRTIIVLVLYQYYGILGVIIALAISGFIFVIFLMYFLRRLQENSNLKSSDFIMVFFSLLFMILVNFNHIGLSILMVGVTILILSIVLGKFYVERL